MTFETINQIAGIMTAAVVLVIALLWFFSRDRLSPPESGWTLPVRDPYYAAVCLHCGYTDSSEAWDPGATPGGDDFDPICPWCNRTGIADMF